MRSPRRWRSGLGVAIVAFSVGTVRLLATGDTGWLTSAWLVLAAVYAFAALVARRLAFPERPRELLGPPERRSRFAALLPHTAGLGMTDRTSVVDAAERIRVLQRGSDEAMTKNRIANAVVTLAAIVGIVLVVTGAGQKSDQDDDGNAPATPPTSQVAPAPPSQNQPGQNQPGQLRPGSSAPSPAPAPAAPEKDDDG